MRIDTAKSAELLLKLNPDCTVAYALKEATRELEEGSVAAAAAWTRFSSKEARPARRRNGRNVYQDPLS
jgi:hypothetical protein